MNPKSIIDYLRSARVELEKVSWPSRRDTIRYSSLVIGASFLLAVFFAALDFSLGQSVDFLLQRRTASSAAAPSATPSAAQNVPLQLTPDALEATTPDGRPADITVTPLNSGTVTPSTNNSVPSSDKK